MAEVFSVEYKRAMLAEPSKPIAGIERLVEPLQRHARRELKTRIPAKAVPLYTDAWHDSAHGADEHVKLSDIEAATRMIKATLRDVLRSK